MELTNFRIRSSKWELLLYAGIWGVVFLCPFLDAGEKVIDGEDFRWESIWALWGAALPFFVLFLVHTFLLLPKLLFAGRTKSYGLCVGILLVLFVGYESVRKPAPKHPPGPIPERLQPPPPEMRDGECPDGERPLRFEPDRPLLPKRKPHPVPGTIVIDTVIAVLLLTFGIAVRLIFDYYRQKRRMMEFEEARVQQELTYLKAQISPHFFMNMLNNIHGMVEFDAAKAQEMILGMSNLMRYVLYESSAPTIRLSQELTFIGDYISLMRGRYSQKKVSIEYHAPKEPVPDTLFIPPLIFIVFIENAFKYGISYRTFSFIKVDLAIAGNRLSFRCANSRPRKTDRGTEGGGIGLKNIRKRLEMLYGDDFTLQIEDGDATFLVTLNIPIYEHTMYSRG